ncbi:T6SS effector BTH_I2691 family protein [Lysobacter soli]|uniref:T6SS effector BTH_I2691 family protein n=1 Tax=Lysobacter soli TaxID=453783 RepID=UPI003CEF38F6
MDKDTFNDLRKQLHCLDEGSSNTGVMDCNQDLVLLPLRYAVVGMDDNEPDAALPSLPPTLGLDLPQLQRARYAVQMLREGYMYAFLKRLADGSWEAVAMQVANQGRISVYDPDRRPPRVALEAMKRGLQRNQQPDATGSALRIPAPYRYSEARFLYTPDPLTPAMQERYRTDDALRGTLQVFNLSRLRNEPRSSLDAIGADQFNDLVLDYRLRVGKTSIPFPAPQQPRPPFSVELESRLAGQLYPLDERPLPKPTEVQAGIVLHDPIGITQELNAWRNASTEQLKDWLDYRGKDEDQDGVTNERRVLVAQTFLELRNSFTTRRTAALLDGQKRHIADLLDHSARPPGMSDEEWNKARQTVEGAYVTFNEAELLRRAKAGEFATRFKDKYERRVNMPMMSVALQQFNNHAAMAQAGAARRAPDHLAWLQSERLLKALDAYDDNDTGSGLCFAHQTGLCVLGVDGDERGAKLLRQWWQADKPERPNLALRGYVLNQQSIATALEQTVAKLGTANSSDGLDAFEATLQKSKDLAAQYGAVDGYPASPCRS